MSLLTQLAKSSILNTEHEILGPLQRFKFNEVHSCLAIPNVRLPLANVPTITDIEVSNGFSGGFRFRHQTGIDQIAGNLKFQCYKGVNSFDVFEYDEAQDKLTFFKNLEIPNLTTGGQLVTKDYVDNKTWLTSSISDFTNSVQAFKLNELATPTANLNLNNKLINNLANGIADTDAVNLSQLKALGFSSLSTNGLLARTAANTYVPRTFAVGLSGNLTITNSDGVSGNPTIDLKNNIILDRVTINNAPVSSTDGINKAFLDQYIDSVVSAMDWKNPVNFATTVDLTATYNNGTNGVGATLTSSSNGVLITDGYSPSVGNRGLIKNRAIQSQNGIYTVTNIGSATTPWVLTRATDYDSINDITPGNLIVVINGTINANTTWLQSTSMVAIGTTPIVFTKFSYAATDFLEVTNNLSDLSDFNQARSNLGLNNAITTLNISGSGLNIYTAPNQATFSLNPLLQSIADSLTAGFAVKAGIPGSGAYIYVHRNFVAGSSSILITNESGINGNPTFDVSTGLKALDGLSSNGFLKRTAANTFNAVATIDLNSDTSSALPISKISATGTASASTVLYGDGSWKTNPIGTVTSVNISVGTGMTGGGTITTNGTISTGLNTELQGLSALATNGILSRTAAGTYSTSSTINISTQTSSTLPVSRLATTGTTDSTTYLRGDGTWAPITINVATQNLTNVRSIQTDSTIIDINNSAGTSVFAFNTLSSETEVINQFSHHRSTLPIYINASYQTSSAYTYGFLNSGGTAASGTDKITFSLWATSRIKASEFNAWSSLERKKITVKDNKVLEKSLEIFKKIEYFGYEYKDKILDGPGEFYGVIAEQVRDVWNDIVGDEKEFVPNIFMQGSCKKLFDNNFEICIKENFDESLNLKKGDKIKIIIKDKILYPIFVKKDKNKIILNINENLPDQIFLYGTVKPCPSVAKQKLFEVGLIVLKDVLKRVENLEELASI